MSFCREAMISHSVSVWRKSERWQLIAEPLDEFCEFIRFYKISRAPARRRIYIPRICVHPCSSVGVFVPTDYTDLHWCSAYPCLSVFVRGRYISHWFHWSTLLFCVSVFIRARPRAYISPCPGGQKSQLSKLFPLSAQCVVLRATSCWIYVV